MNKLRVGVFDSGIGGLAVVNAIQRQLPQVEVLFKNDSQHVPYGSRPIDEIYGFTKPIIQKLVDSGCQIIVIACNTVTTNLIQQLRHDFNIAFIGLEPMVKPAAVATKTGVIAVCATPRTLSSERYKWLKKEYAQGVKVLEPDCSDWSYMVETDSVDHQKIEMIVDEVCDGGADQIVLGCTHYHWIEKLIKSLARGRAEVIQPEQAIARRLRKVIEMQAGELPYKDVGQHGIVPSPKNPKNKPTSEPQPLKIHPHAAGFHKSRTAKSTTLIRLKKRLS